MGKERYQPPSFSALVKSGIVTPYEGDNKERIKIKNLFSNFHSQIKDAQGPNYSENYLRDVCVGLRLLALEEINEKPVHAHLLTRVKTGSRLVSTIVEQLGIKNKNDISGTERFVYLMKLYTFVQKNPGLLDESHKIKLEKAINKVFQEIKSDIDHLLNSIPTEYTIDNKLKILDRLYSDTKNPDQKRNEWRHFLAQLGEAIAYICEHDPVLSEESKELGFNRTWQLKIGALIYFMEIARRDTYIHSDFYDVCSNIVASLNKIDEAVQQQCLSNFKCFINSYHYRNQIKEFGKTHYPQSNLFAAIDGSLERYTEILDSKLRSLRHCADSHFPNFTFTLGLIGAVIMYATVGGLGAAAGKALAQTDTMVPYISSLSHLLSKGMRLTLGASGRNMAYKASELVASETISRSLAHVCGGAGALVGFAMGMAPGACLDFSLDAYQKFCKTFAIKESCVKEEDLELAVALLNLPASVFAQELKDRIQYKTQGLFNRPVEKEGTVTHPTPAVLSCH